MLDFTSVLPLPSFSSHMTPFTTLAAADPWQTYEEHGKGKGKGPPVIPEAATTGLIIVGLALLLVLSRWYQTKWRGPKCGCGGGCSHHED